MDLSRVLAHGITPRCNELIPVNGATAVEVQLEEASLDFEQLMNAHVVQAQKLDSRPCQRPDDGIRGKRGFAAKGSERWAASCNRG